MRVETLRTAIAEAERFLKAAKAVPIERITGEGMMAGKKWERVSDYHKKTAACKRASLDLSMALSEMRKP